MLTCNFFPNMHVREKMHVDMKFLHDNVYMQFFPNMHVGKKMHVDMNFLHVNVQKIVCQHAKFFKNCMSTCKSMSTGNFFMSTCIFFRTCMFGKKSHVNMQKFHVNMHFFPNMHVGKKILCQHAAPFS
jgi:hypothetical protein